MNCNFPVSRDPAYRVFLSTLLDYDMMRDASSVLIGLSGGADSCSLLCMFIEYSRSHPIKLKAMHVNHMIRAAEAERDEVFCRELCESAGVEFEAVSVDIPDIAQKSKKGLEEAARDERYKIFRTTALKEGFDRISVAHNAQDNAETVIFNMTRGASATGASGIAPVRENIIRPLIRLTKSEITDFCQRHNIRYVIDSTNSDINYTRNFIRHEIFPKLKQLNPNVEKAFSNFSACLCEDNSALLRIAENHVSEGKTDVLRSLEPAVLKRVLILKAAGAGISLSHYQLEKTAELILRTSKDRTVSSVSLPEGKAFFISADRLVIGKDIPAKERVKKEPGITKPLYYGNNTFFEYRISLGTVPRDDADENALIFSIPESEIRGSLFVRNRLPQDTYVCAGMTKKIKKMLCDAGSKIEERGRIPFVCDADGILAVYGLPLSDRVRKNVPSASDKSTQEPLVFVCIEKRAELTERSGIFHDNDK